MSSALVRQALELVDPEESVGGRGKKAKSSRSSPGQVSELGRPYKNKRKQKQPKKQPSSDEVAEENIRKLLALSQHIADPAVTKKIVARCVAGKPVAPKPAPKPAAEKSILFPDDAPPPPPRPRPRR